MMRTILQWTLILGIVASWAGLAILIIRQHQLLETADPMRDTGLSFGYVFLIGFAAPGLLGMTAILAAVLFLLKRGSRRKQPGQDRAAGKP